MTCKDYSVYLLFASDEPAIPRYVGQTVQMLQGRLRGHHSSAFFLGSVNRPVCKWFRSVVARGAHVEISPVMSGLTLEQSRELESQMINYLKESVWNKEGLGRPAKAVPNKPLEKQFSEDELIEMSQSLQALCETLQSGQDSRWELTPTGQIIARDGQD